MKTLYVLECQNSKWYIGTTNRPLRERIVEHFVSAGAEWTKRNPPVKVAQTMEDVDEFEEDKQTKLYMLRYGIATVRGGSYVQVCLPDFQLQALKKELATIGNRCFKCEKTGHYAADCETCPGCVNFYETDCVDCAVKYIEEDHDDYPQDILRYAAQRSACTVMKCMVTRFGADPSNSDVSNEALDAAALHTLIETGGRLSPHHLVKLSRSEKCFSCGGTDHFAEGCRSRKFPLCFRCGKTEHFRHECNEIKDIYGRAL